jgi:hypothetical protein
MGTSPRRTLTGSFPFFLLAVTGAKRLSRVHFAPKAIASSRVENLSAPGVSRIQFFAPGFRLPPRSSASGAEKFEEALPGLQDEKDLKGFIGWVLRGTPGYKK